MTHLRPVDTPAEIIQERLEARQKLEADLKRSGELLAGWQEAVICFGPGRELKLIYNEILSELQNLLALENRDFKSQLVKIYFNIQDNIGQNVNGLCKIEGQPSSKNHLRLALDFEALDDVF